MRICDLSKTHRKKKNKYKSIEKHVDSNFVRYCNLHKSSILHDLKLKGYEQKNLSEALHSRLYLGYQEDMRLKRNSGHV